MPHDAQAEIDGLGFDSVAASRFDERPKRSHVNRPEVRISDQLVQLSKVQRIVSIGALARAPAVESA
jgi:gamma-glutamyl:cysteine ligase YbdK (ATP-grasp superfamily)